jgi:hypothetical protein
MMSNKISMRVVSPLFYCPSDMLIAALREEGCKWQTRYGFTA